MLLRLSRPACAVIALWASALAAPVHAQQTDTRPGRPALSELERLREAADRESAGDIDTAERIVLDVLAANPTSLTALLRLERVLGLQGRLDDIGPHVDRLLERDVASVIGHQLRLRVLHELDDAAGVAAAVRTWSDAMPRLETPYREGALVWRERGENARAIALLEQGRERIREADALALELGDAWIAAGDHEAAAGEWARAVGADGRGFMLVQRRMQQLPDAGAAVIPLLLDRLHGEPLSTGRYRAATVLAIDAGLAGQAHQLARDLIGIARTEDREPLLIEVARRADGAGLYRVATWAYGQLLASGPDATAGLAIRSRIAELALLDGDTALAAATYRELERAAEAGSPQRRQAVALRIQLAARDGDVRAAAADFDAFQREYPQAAELDATAAAIAAAQIEAGDVAAAEASLAGVRGVHSSRLRGRLLLRRGDIAAARDELLAAAPMLHGAEATETIALAALLMRVSPEGGELVAAVTAAPDIERGEVIREAARAAMTMPARERSAILDFLAASADRYGLAADADEIRRSIVDEIPAAQEVPAALLALAARARQHNEADEARMLLEKLITEYPRSALLPRARSELQMMGK